jgi:FtsZ-binding cell division protein ZapB
MNTLSNMERMNLSNAKALRRAREQLKVTKLSWLESLRYLLRPLTELKREKAY